MKKNCSSAKRILVVRRILLEETDSKHTISAKGIKEHLQEENIRVNIKTVYHDIKRLRESGESVVFKNSKKPVGYYMETMLSDDAMKTLADALCAFRSARTEDRVSILETLRKNTTIHQWQHLEQSIRTCKLLGWEGDRHE